MKHTPQVEYINCGRGFYYVEHPGRNILIGKYLGVNKENKVDWANTPIYFSSREQATNCLFELKNSNSRKWKEVERKKK